MNFPALHGNWVDLFIFLVVVFYLFSGWNRGFFLGVLDLGGFILSFVFALKSYNFFGQLLVINFSLPFGISNAVGFLLAGFVVEAVFSFLMGIFFKTYYIHLLEALHRRRQGAVILKINRIAGCIPALGEAIVFIAFMFTLVVTLPVQGSIKKDIISSKLGGPLVAKTQGIEQQLKIIFGQAVNDTLTFLTVNSNPSSLEKVNLRFTTADVSTDEKAEEAMLVLVNLERNKGGLKKLVKSEKLHSLARSYAKDMFARGYFSHYNPENQSPFDRMHEAQILFNAAGENLALAPNVNLAHQGLINSPGHKANILSADFGHVGIGVMDGGIYGEMFVQEFTD